MGHKESTWELLSRMTATKGKEQNTSVGLTFPDPSGQIGIICPTFSPDTVSFRPYPSGRERNGVRVKKECSSGGQEWEER